MKAYELLYIIDAQVADEKKEEIINKVNDLINNNGGKAEEADKWGIRNYAYPIAYKNEGYYVLVNFTAPANLPSMLDGQLLIIDGIVRHMISAK